MLIIPALPLTSYFEGGIINYFYLSIADAGILSNPVWPQNQWLFAYHQLKR
jgi:hypothetical protein